MNKLKYSAFNYKTEDKSGNVLLYNSLYKTIRKYEKEYRIDIEDLSSDPNAQINPNLRSDLEKCGFLVIRMKK